MCSDVGSQNNSHAFLHVFKGLMDLKLAAINTSGYYFNITSKTQCLLPFYGEQATGWIGMSSGVTIPILCSFCIFFGGKNWPAVKIFWPFFVHWVFSFLSPKKRWQVLIIVVAWVWFNTSEVTASERQVEASTHYGPDLFWPFLSSFITKGVWLIVSSLRYQKKTK